MNRAVLPSLALLILGTVACSSGSFDVTDPGAADTASDDVADSSAEDSSSPGEDSATPDTTTADTTTPDTTTLDAKADGVAPDTLTILDSAKPDVTTTPDTSECIPGTTTSCECTGTKTCLMTGRWGGCENKCLPSPFRFLCAYGHDGCTNTSCLDSNNCVAVCGCGSAPGSTCALSDPCWGFVCNGYVCPM